MNRLICAVTLMAVFTLGNACCVMAADKTPEQLVKEAKGAIKELSVSDVRKMIDANDKIILLDVREKDEFAEGRLPGAINIPRGSLEFKSAAALPDKSARIIVYCGTDRRSPLATRTLNELGYTNAVNMQGGLNAWKAAGYTLEK